MRLADLLTLPLIALWQQKLRTLLTTLGVMFGAFVLAASLSIGNGVQETLDRESHRSDVSRRVEVYPKWIEIGAEVDPGSLKVAGTMNDARRDRIGKTLAEQKREQNAKRFRVELTPERLGKLSAIPHVERLVPVIQIGGRAVFGKNIQGVQVVSARPDDKAGPRRIVAGRFFNTPDERAVVISEFLAYRLGVQHDNDIEGLIGKTLRLEFGVTPTKTQGNAGQTDVFGAVSARVSGALGKLTLAKPVTDAVRQVIRALPVEGPKFYAVELTIAGVIRRPTEEELHEFRDSFGVEPDVLVPCQTAADIFFHGPGPAGRGVERAVLFVETEKDVKDVVIGVMKMGLDFRARLEDIDRERMIYLLIFGGMTCVAGVALLVAALGIANTMLMSVLERTREIGIMKAVGADNRHLQFIFVVEGGLIGLLGGLIGLLLAWAASYPGDAWVRAMVLRDIKIDLKESIFIFPPSLALSVLVFTVLVTTLAAVYPARHAARIDPVTALRHE